MAGVHWLLSMLCLVGVSSSALISGDPQRTENVTRTHDTGSVAIITGSQSSLSFSLPSPTQPIENDSQQPKARERRAAFAYPGCVITIDDPEADALSKMLRGMMSIFTQKPQPVTPTTVESDNEIRYICDSGVSNVKASIWFILNRVWLATSCQYPDEEAFQHARSQVEREGKKVSKILYNVDVRSPEGSILLDTYASTVKEVETMLEDALDTMDRVHEARQCNSVNVKQVTEVFEAGMQEILSLKTAMEAQRKQTEEALEALAAQREETKKALEVVESLKGETSAALGVCAKQKLAMEDALKTLKEQSERSDQGSVDSVECRNVTGCETGVLELDDVTENPSVDEVGNFSVSFSEENYTSWKDAIQNKETDDIIAWAINPVHSAILANHIQPIVSEAYSNDPENTAAVLDFLAKLPEKLATTAGEGQTFSQTKITEWALKKIREGKGEDVNRAIGGIKLEDEIPKLVTILYSNETRNMDAVLAFIDKLPTQSASLTAYKTLFATLNHTRDTKESIRLIYKMHKSSIKFNETLGLSSSPSFLNFLLDNVHPQFLKLIGGEFFLLDALYGTPPSYVYLYTNPRDANLLQHAARTKNSTADDRKEAKWFWQILPVPGLDGNVFYIRNKLNALKAIDESSRVEENHLELVVPENYPIVKQPEVPFQDTLELYFWSIKNKAYYNAQGDSTPIGVPLKTGIKWWWKIEFP